MRYEWRPYVPVAARRRKAAHEMARLESKTGRSTAAVVIEGRRIATTFWGKAWCDNLERYSDYANRLPRGRTYVRNGSVVDLTLTAGKVTARVSGSDLYTVTIDVAPLPTVKWKALCAESAGAIDSVVELLQGRFAKGVMERLCQPRTGLFPAPSEMTFSCSCPDWASMCKHVAASLYGVGSRLDRSPELFFILRQVNEKDLIAQAGVALARPGKIPASGRVLSTGGLEELFGLDLGPQAAPPGKPVRIAAKRKGAALGKKLQPPRVPPRLQPSALAAKGRLAVKRTSRSTRRSS